MGVKADRKYNFVQLAYSRFGTCGKLDDIYVCILLELSTDKLTGAKFGDLELVYLYIQRRRIMQPDIYVEHIGVNM